jgi:hypothetical protein
VPPGFSRAGELSPSREALDRCDRGKITRRGRRSLTLHRPGSCRELCSYPDKVPETVISFRRRPRGVFYCPDAFRQKLPFSVFVSMFFLSSGTVPACFWLISGKRQPADQRKSTLSSSADSRCFSAFHIL